MKRFVKPLARTGRTLALAAGLTMLFPYTVNGEAKASGLLAKAKEAAELPAARVQVNDTLVSFPDVQPYVNEDGWAVVPIRPMAEALGAKLELVGRDGAEHICLRLGQKRLDLFNGTNFAFMDALPDIVESPTELRGGRMAIALRTLLRWLQIEGEWDEETRTVIISADGRPHEPVSRPVGEKSERILETVDDYMGVPYVWGGTKPSGFDCSGFVQYVYRRHGVELPRTSREMYAIGNAVQELQPGDLVFFRTLGNATSHVGIYLGDNQFISATTSYGVHVANLYSTYWGPKYIGAKRVL